MKTFFSILIISTILYSDDLSWVNEQIDAIKPPRHGLKSSYISKTKNPFVFLDKEAIKTTKSKAKIYKRNKVNKKIKYNSKKVNKQKFIKEKTANDFILKIVLNKAFMINNKWYKEGDKISGYKIIKLNFNTVLLDNKKREIILTTKSQNSKLKFNQ